MGRPSNESTVTARCKMATEVYNTVLSQVRSTRKTVPRPYLNELFRVNGDVKKMELLSDVVLNLTAHGHLHKHMNRNSNTVEFWPRENKLPGFPAPDMMDASRIEIQRNLGDYLRMTPPRLATSDNIGQLIRETLAPTMPVAKPVAKPVSTFVEDTVEDEEEFTPPPPNVVSHTLEDTYPTLESKEEHASPSVHSSDVVMTDNVLTLTADDGGSFTFSVDETRRLTRFYRTLFLDSEPRPR